MRQRQKVRIGVIGSGYINARVSYTALLTRLIALLFLLLCPRLYALPGQWVTTTESQRWVEKSAPAQTSWSAKETYIELFEDSEYQKMEGLGGCFNELGWDVISLLSPAGKDSILRALFDSTTGCGLNVGRYPVGANDYAMGYYSLNDSAGDYDMSAMTLARDRQRLIPYVKAAMVYQPQMHLYGAPWTPPAWMKQNNDYAGGHLSQDDKTLSAYALYHSKVAQMLTAEGLQYLGVFVQNEPEIDVTDSKYPTCAWSTEELNNYIKNYLGPRFAQDKLTTKIWLGTFCCVSYEEMIKPILGDADSRKYIAGVGVQWQGNGSAAATHADYPSLGIIETESKCCPYENNWDAGNNIFRSITEHFEAWASVFLIWNMPLDETGKSFWGWDQSSLITINRNSKQVTYHPSFYALKHFSHYIKRDAFRIKSQVHGSFPSKQIAFKNPNGELVVALSNEEDADKSITIKNRNQMISVTLAPHSLNTITFPGPAVAVAPLPATKGKNQAVRVLQNGPSGLTLNLTLPKAEHVSVDLLSSSGRHISQLHCGRVSGVCQTIRFSTTATLPAGLYLLQVNSENGYTTYPVVVY